MMLAFLPPDHRKDYTVYYVHFLISDLSLSIQAPNSNQMYTALTHLKRHLFEHWRARLVDLATCGGTCIVWNV